MGNNNTFGDIWRVISSANLTVGSSGGAATSTAVFGSETYAVQICHVNSVTGSTSGVRVLVGTAPTAVGSSLLLPPNWPYIHKVTPGERLSAISNDAQTPSLNVAELTK